MNTTKKIFPDGIFYRMAKSIFISLIKNRINLPFVLLGANMLSAEVFHGYDEDALNNVLLVEKDSFP